MLPLSVYCLKYRGRLLTGWERTNFKSRLPEIISEKMTKLNLLAKENRRWMWVHVWISACLITRENNWNGTRTNDEKKKGKYNCQDILQKTFVRDKIHIRTGYSLNSIALFFTHTYTQPSANGGGLLCEIGQSIRQGFLYVYDLFVPFLRGFHTQRQGDYSEL